MGPEGSWLGQGVGQASGFPVSCAVRCWGVSPELLGIFGPSIFLQVLATSVFQSAFFSFRALRQKGNVYEKL